MRPLAALLILFVMCSSTAHAIDCREPTSPMPLPDGKQATRPEMAAAARKVRQYNADMEVYLDCLKTTTQQKTVGAGWKESIDTHVKLMQIYDDAVVKLTGTANCMNDQLREFKATGGGSGSKEPADCSAAFAAVKAGAESNADQIRKAPVVDTPAKRVELPTGAYSYLLRHGGDLVPCREREVDNCDVYKLIVENDSEQALECSVHMNYLKPNIEEDRHVEGRAALLPGETRIVLRNPAQLDNVPAEFAAECKPRPTVTKRTSEKECNFRITKSVMLGDYYPEDSLHLRHEGPVMVEFTLNKGAGRPSNLAVVFSSLYDDLDDAARKAVGAMEMSADCGPQRHRLAIRWELKDE